MHIARLIIYFLFSEGGNSFLFFFSGLLYISLVSGPFTILAEKLFSLRVLFVEIHSLDASLSPHEWTVAEAIFNPSSNPDAESFVLKNDSSSPVLFYVLAFFDTFSPCEDFVTGSPCCSSLPQ